MNPPAPGVAILLCTRNGGRYLREQLDSIARQEYGDWRVYASDDASTDDTLDCLRRWGSEVGARLAPWRNGPCRGHAANFLSLLCAGDVSGEYFAYADQDDIWDSDKLSRALAALAPVPVDTPALYCSRTRTLAVTGELQGYSPLFSRPPGFANALLQNIAGGNTMVLNGAARRLMISAGCADVVSHDWWTYLLVAGAGGVVIYDPEPCLSYRQHEHNAIGASTGLKSRMRRYGEFLRGRNQRWYARNIAALRQCEALLTERNRQVLAYFEAARHGGPFHRLSALVKSGVHAQTTSGQLGLYTATLLKKI